jgi:hypothetical protein
VKRNCSALSGQTTVEQKPVEEKIVEFLNDSGPGMEPE